MDRQRRDAQPSGDVPPQGQQSAVGERIARLRQSRGLSLSALARAAGIGKGSLSELESGQRNPTLSTLYAVAGQLGVPLTSLVGTVAGVEASDGVLTARLLHVDQNEDGTTTEVYWLDVRPGRARLSPSHGSAVTEHVLVLRGTLRAGPQGQESSASAGQWLRWTSDTAHSYEAVGVPAEPVAAVCTITLG